MIRNKANILYFTYNHKCQHDFINNQKKRLQDVLKDSAPQNRRINISFIEQEGSSFLYGSELSNFISSYEGKLSELIIIVANDVLLTPQIYLRLHPVIIEYPEINFLFESQSPDEIISNLFPMSEYAHIYEAIEKKEKDLASILTHIDDFFLKKDSQITLSSLSIELGKESKRKTLTEKELVDIAGQIKKYLSVKEIESSLLPMAYYEGDAFLHTLLCIDNCFDGSNLRYAIKQWKQADMHIRCNYPKAQQSRCHNLALVVDEEGSQCLFNSYILYANGFRVIPISSATLLRKIGKQQFSANNKIIVRDFDLQFDDEDPQITGENISGLGNVTAINEVDYIRGYKLIQSESSEEWRNLINEDNDYWSTNDYVTGKVYFVTYGYEHLNIDSKQRIADIPTLPGMYKPVVGIKTSFTKNMPSVKERSKKLLYNKYITDEYKMDLMREGHNHGVPLDLYNMSKKMIDRAEKYLSDKEYLYAAIVSYEAYELLNGFHKALTLHAYYLYIKAENSLALDILGGDDQILADDVRERINTIVADVDRILGTGSESKEKSSAIKATKMNVLNQIFSDCRQFCKEKEYFKAEDVFVGAMAKLNDGNHLIDSVVDRIYSLIYRQVNKKI